MKELICEFCGEVLNEENAYELDGHIMCHLCKGEQVITCICCGKTLLSSDNSGSFETPLCASCFDRHYTYCEECGRIIYLDDALYFHDNDEPYCNSCYENILGEQYIHNYGYKPEPIFYGDEKLYMGVELEIDMGGEDKNSAEEILNVANFQREHIYCKHDGSIEEGFEMVSHPNDDVEDMYVEDIKSIAKYYGYAPEAIDELIAGGFTLEEIEEYIYCME